MKEVCGYEGLDKKFYKNKKECEDADLRWKIKTISDKLDNIPSYIERIVFLYASSDACYEFSRNSSVIMSLVAKVVFQERNAFLSIIEESKKLEKELDRLQELDSHKWWLKIKWWKNNK